MFKVAKWKVLNRKVALPPFYLFYSLARNFLPSSSNPGLSSSANMFAL